jgi:hypothetical protein
VAGSLSEVAIRYPGLPLFQFEPEQAWLEQAGACLQHHETRRFSQNFTSLKDLMSAIRKMGGAHTGQFQAGSNHSGPDFSLWKQWLQDQTPIALSFEVLFLQLEKPASAHALSFLYGQ